MLHTWSALSRNGSIVKREGGRHRMRERARAAEAARRGRGRREKGGRPTCCTRVFNNLFVPRLRGLSWPPCETHLDRSMCRVISMSCCPTTDADVINIIQAFLHFLLHFGVRKRELQWKSPSIALQVRAEWVEERWRDLRTSSICNLTAFRARLRRRSRSLSPCRRTNHRISSRSFPSRLPHTAYPRS